MNKKEYMRLMKNECSMQEKGSYHMASNSNVKLKILYLMKIIWEKTDENHPITINELIDELQSYGISAERKSIYSDIELLKNFGMDIICKKERANQYFIGARDFELPELKLLVDAVESSRFITCKKSQELIKKIEKLCSLQEAKSLHRQIVVSDRIKTINESIYYNVDVIHSAIQENKQIQFKYFQYTVNKDIIYRRGGEYYVASPYALTWSNDNYYLVGYYERYHDISNFRVDRMKDIQIVDKKRIMIEDFKNFSIAEYSNKIFSMYSGKAEKVKLQFDNSLINVVIDRFGQEVFIESRKEDCFCITVDVVASDTFLGWLFMFGDKVRILSPDTLKEKMKETAKNIERLY